MDPGSGMEKGSDPGKTSRIRNTEDKLLALNDVSDADSGPMRTPENITFYCNDDLLHLSNFVGTECLPVLNETVTSPSKTQKKEILKNS